MRILCDQLFDGHAFVDERRVVDIDGASIEAVHPPERAPPHIGETLDLRGLTVLPGLINTHVHLARGGMFGPMEPISVPQVADNLRLALQAGITTVGEMGCTAPLARALRHLADDAAEAGPDILCAGPLVTAPEGYPLDWLPSLYADLGIAVACGSPSEGKETARYVAESGMDHLKLAIMHRSYSDEPLPTLSPEVAKAVVDEAHTLGLDVYAHAHSNDDYELALDAGVDALMHSSFEPLDETLVARIRDAGVQVCPTLWVFEAVCAGAEGCWYRDARYREQVRPPVRREWKEFCEAYAESADVLPAGIAEGLPKRRVREAVRTAASNLKLLREEDVPIAFGNDAAYGFCVHGRPVDELLAMERAGLPPHDCLHSATARAADLLGCDDRGVLEAGRRADVIAVEGDPREDLSCMERVETVVAEGHRVDTTERSRLAHLARTGGAVARGLAGTLRDAASRL